MSVFRTKSVEASMAASEEADHKLKRTLSALDLTVFGIGVIIGAGIFTLTGRAAKDYAGPSIALSFVIGAHRLRPRRALLRRVRLDGPGLGIGLHLLLRDARRARRVDHRLGPAPRAHARRERGRPGLVGVLRDLPRATGSRPGRVGRAGVALRPAGLPAHRRPDAAHRVGHQGVAARQPRARRRQALHRAVRHLRGHRVHQPRQLVALHPAVAAGQGRGGPDDARCSRSSPA